MDDQSESHGRLTSRISTDDLVDEYSGLAGAIPYADQVIAAYRLVRTRRIKSFLRGMTGAAAELSEADTARFNSYINSPTGREVLADFAECALRVRTKITTAALAILFADFDNRLYAEDFKGAAVLNLESLTDRTIDAFLLLCSNRQALTELAKEGPYPVVALRQATVDGNNVLAAWSSDGRGWIAAVNDLVGRGLFDSDWAAGMRLGDEQWVSYFSFSESSVKYEQLLRRARLYSGGDHSA